MRVGAQWVIVFLGGLALSTPARPQDQPSTPPAAPATQGFRISGAVVDALTGAPVAYARVAIAATTNRDDLRTMNADENGRFFFEGLSAGKYSLTAERRGYVSQAYLQHDQYSTSIAAGPDLVSEGIVFPLRPEAAITGRVTDDYGEPVRDARVMLFQAGLPRGHHAVFTRNIAITNDLGAYRFSHLAPGQYYVAVSASPWYARHAFADPGAGRPAAETQAGSAIRFSPAQQEVNPALDVAFPVTFYPSAAGSDGASLIKLPAGERFVADISVRAVTALHLRVPVNGSGPEEHRSVALRQQVFDGVTVPVPSEERKSGDDAMAIAGVAPGRYIVDVHTSGEGGAGSAASMEIDVLSDGQVSAGKDRILTPVSGSVKLEPGSSAMPQGALVLREKKTELRYVAQISPKGDFEFRQPIPAGDYNLDLSARGYTVKRLSGTATVRGETVQISGKAPVKLTVELTEGLGTIEGVALRDGKPVAAAMVVLVPEDPANNAGLFRRDQSDSDGTFTLSSILPGKYTVLAIENGWELEWANPEVLKQYLPHGVVVQVGPRGKHKVKVQAQSASQP